MIGRRAGRLPSRAPRWWALVVPAAFALTLVGCAGDEDLGGPTASGLTVPVATLPPIAPTAPTAPGPSTTPPSTAAPTTVAPTAPPAPTTTVAPTTSVGPTTSRPTTTVAAAPAAPCDLDLIVEQTQTAYEGITPADLGCADGWAAWIGRPDDQFADGFFAVARWSGTTWELVNLGTAGICADAGVPQAIWDELGCFE